VTKLGKLERVIRIQDIWPSEERSFTPWLADSSLDLLSEALGFGNEGLEKVATEVPIPGSSYHADILCRETGSGEDSLVLIENQYGVTNHTHLGQLITYASGFQAKSVVIIAETVRPEHRAALDWLNSLSTDGCRFFAVEVELWRIGESLPAPRFNVVVQPNDWTRKAVEARKVSEEGQRSESAQILFDYWQAYEQLLTSRRGPVRAVRPVAQSWIVHGLGKTGVTLNASLNRRENWVRAEVYLSGRTAIGYYSQLKSDQAEIESSFGGPLQWYEEAANDRRIIAQKNFASVTDRTTWPEQHAWIAGQLEALHRAFHERIRGLDAEVAKLN
jgi:hypothetical protein